MGYRLANTILDTGTEFHVVTFVQHYVPKSKPCRCTMGERAAELAERLAAERIEKRKVNKRQRIADAGVMLESAWQARNALETRRDPSEHIDKLAAVAAKYRATVATPCDLTSVVVSLRFASEPTWDKQVPLF